MPRLRIHTKPFAGEYELDLDAEPLTMAEWRIVKRVSGYLPGTIALGIRDGDVDVTLALAVVALTRGGRIADSDAVEVANRLARAQVESLEELDDEPGEVPFSPAQATESPTQNGGESSSSTSASPAPLPPPTGRPDSERSATSGRVTSRL